MRHVVCSLVAGAALSAAILSGGASAQTIVDLTKPPTGKSRYVLNPDLTPADLGMREEEKPAPIAAVSRGPACGQGCKLEQPDLPSEQRYGYGRDPNSYRTRNGTRVILVGGFGNNQPQ